MWLQKSGHLIGIDVERRTVIEAVVRFFNKHGGRRLAGAPPPLPPEEPRA